MKPRHFLPLLLPSAAQAKACYSTRTSNMQVHHVRCRVAAKVNREGETADLEREHRARARCEDRIRCAKQMGLELLPFADFEMNAVWMELVLIAGLHSRRDRARPLPSGPWRRRGQWGLAS